MLKNTNINMAFLCKICNNNIAVTQKRIKCTVCSQYYHTDCIKPFKDLTTTRAQWKCTLCQEPQIKNTESFPDNISLHSSKPKKQLRMGADVTYQSKSLSRSPSYSSPVNKMDQHILATPEKLGSSDFLLQCESIIDKRLKSAMESIVNELKESLMAEIKKEIFSEFKNLEESHSKLRMEYNALEERYIELESLVLKSETEISDLKAQTNKQQQWSRMANLEIMGLPETKGEALCDIVIKIAKYAGVNLRPEEIEFATRVQPLQQKTGRPKSLVVKLRSRDLKDSILSGLRKCRGIDTTNIGLNGDPRRFFVNEHLTPMNKDLFRKTKTLAAEKAYRFVWVRNCNIFLRKNEECPVLTINSEKDLRKIK